MARNVHYEVLVQQGARWQIHSRHSADEKDAAINEAKSLEKLPYIAAVKVIKETYRPDEGTSDEALVYKSGHPEPPRKASSRVVIKPSAGGGMRRGGGGPAIDWNAEDEEERPGWFARWRRRKPAEPTGGVGVVVKLLLVTLFSIAISAMVTGLTALALSELATRGFRAITPKFYANALFGVFVITFLVSAIPMAMRYLANVRFANRARPAAAPQAAVQPVAPPVTSETAMEPPPIPEVPGGAETDDALNAEVSVPESQEPEPASAAEAPPAGVVEREKMFVVTFLSQGLEQVKATRPTLDTFNKFGVNLFLAGACEAMSSARQLDEETSHAVLGATVQVLGFSGAQATAFANKVDEYLLADSRYTKMYEAGRNAMNTHLGGDAEGAKQLAVALADWNKPKVKEASSGPVTVMFTDMVGSTKLTQTRGDAVAQQVVRVHNRIVREALSQYGGREIKHTGDGIMASFGTTSNGVEAAIMIQRRTAAHNKSNPDLPLNLKVGINAGEPIAEEDDLFGTTVQLAARIVDKAKSGQILVSEIVRGICAGKDIAFTSVGGFEMKGFADPITLFEVAWGGGTAAIPAPAPTASASPRAAPPAQPATRSTAGAPAARPGATASTTATRPAGAAPARAPQTTTTNAGRTTAMPASAPPAGTKRA